MKTLHQLCFIGLAILFSCASTESVLSEFDETIDFNKYSTFVLCIDDLFVENTKYPNHDNNTVRELIGEAIVTQMQNKNHKTNVLNPQLQVGFDLIVEEKEATFTNCEVKDEYNYWQDCTINTEIYTEETIVVYVSDLSKNQIIWQASLTCNLNRSKSRLKGYIHELVDTLFSEYPKGL